MKKPLSIIVLLLINIGISIGQTKTPNCTDVSAYNDPQVPLTSSQINYINNEQQSQFPNVYVFEGPTSSYNCHNYAWLKSVGGSTFWLNSPGDDEFWDDGSYTASSYSGGEGYRVSYQGDHTAVTTTVLNEAISKWGAWGLYKHNITYVPASYLPSSTKTYYRKSSPEVTGPSVLCSTGSYVLNNVPGGYPISWSVSPSSAVSPSSGTGSVANLTRLTTDDVTITFSFPGFGCGSVSRLIYVGAPQFGGFLVNGSSTSSGTACVNSYTPIAAVPNDPSASYYWSQSDPNGFIANASQSSTAFTGYNASCYYLNVSISNACGSRSEYLTMCLNNCFAKYTVYPNPAKDYITVEFDQIESAESLPDEIFLLSEKSTNPIKSINLKEVYRSNQFIGGNQLRIDVRELPRGTYYLHIKDIQKEQNKVDAMRILLE